MSLEDRITELEKNFAKWVSEFGNKTLEIDRKLGVFDKIDILQNEIAELREYMKNQWAKMEFNQTNLQDQLNELKEQFYGKVNMFENWILKLDSGGEKSETGIKGSRDKSCGSIASFPNSKPPEPKWYPGVKEYCDFMEDRLPGGTGIEPREDDKINTLHKIKMMIKLEYPELRIVKREDLERLFFVLDWELNMDTLTHKDYKYINKFKEEYNL